MYIIHISKAPEFKNEYLSLKTNQIVERNLRDLDELKDKKVVMITFDDGPDGKNTNKLLDELEERDVKVTFFMLGSKIEKYPEVALRAYQAGHTVSNHSYSHKDLRKLKEDKLLEEINKTNEILKELNIDNRYFRPPYGFANDYVFNASNMSFIYWSVDPMDWRYKNKKVIYNRIMNKLTSGSIVLVHDIYANSVKAIIDVIDELLDDDYALISLEEAEALGYINATEKKEYYSLKQ